MKILAISANVPAIEGKGDQIVSFFRLMHFVKMGHSVEVLCFGDLRKNEDRNAFRALEAAGILVHIVHWKIWVAALNLFDSFLRTRLPFQCAIYKSALFGKIFDDISSKMEPDIVYCVMIRVAPNITAFRGRLFVEMIDSMWLNFSRRAELAKWPMRWLLNIEKNRVHSYEKYLADHAERSFVVSNIDRNSIDSERVSVIPLGVDILRFSRERRIHDRPVIVFTGNMSYQPNVDAVFWFVRNCWEHIKQLVPNVRFVIAGSSPKASVISLSKIDSSISVTGRVPSIGDILSCSTIAIAPMQSGSGMQFKILEAMACSIPVVTTTLGLGDISATSGEDLLVADTPDFFIASVVKLINCIELNQYVGNCGFRYVLNNHAWDAVNDLFLRKSGLIEARCA